MEKKLTQERLKELLHYEPETGIFYWKQIQGKNKKKVGDVAGTPLNGYITIGIGGTIYLSHRLAWLYIHGYFTENQIDHINRNRADNRICNLREVSRSCNRRNSGNPKNNVSGVKGVCWHKQSNLWRSRITHQGKKYNLGLYVLFDEAVCARLAAEQCLNWSNCDSSSPAYNYVQKMLGECSWKAL